MTTFWIVVILTGAIGALADMVLNQWSKTPSLFWFSMSATLFVVFMTGLGFSIRIGAQNNHPITIALLLVVMINVAGVAIWDVLSLDTQLTNFQWLGLALAITAVACFEIGK